ncbi:hypothetical protein EOM09_07820 [bacterium]|nr:hypothetical protein [bacterium]
MEIKNILMILVIVPMFFIAACSVEAENENIGDGTDIQRQDGDKSEEQLISDNLDMMIADGLYVENLNYETPNGGEEINISLEIRDNTVLSLSIEAIGTPHQISAKWIKESESGLRDLMIGKRIDEIVIPASVSGSSLTTGAFKKNFEELIEKY